MAALTLTAVPFAGDPLFSGTATVTGERYTIGRSTENDWVLADVKRLVSKKHCAIERMGEGFRLVDLSTNGCTVNGRAISRGETARLANGDEFTLGGYSFKASIEQTTRSHAMPRIEDGPQGGLGPLSGAASVSSILQDVSQEANGTEAMPDARPDAFADRVTPNNGSTLGAVGWDGPPRTEIELVEDEAAAGPVRSDFVDRSQQVGPDRQIIDLPRSETPASVPAEEGSPAASSGGAFIPDDWLDSAPNASAKPAPTPVPAEIPALAQDTRAAHVIPVENLDLSVPDLAVPEPSVPVPEPPPVAPAVTTSGGPPPDGADDLVGAFCDGLGIEPGSISGPAGDTGDAMRLMHNVGLALRHASDALMAQTEATVKADAGSAAAERTPWIFAMAGSDRARLRESLALFLSEADPRDLDVVREDHQAVTRFVEELPASLASFVDRFENALPDASGTSFMRFGKPDRWEQFRTELGLPEERAAVRAYLLDLMAVQSDAQSR